MTFCNFFILKQPTPLFADYIQGGAYVNLDPRHQKMEQPLKLVRLSGFPYVYKLNVISQGVTSKEPSMWQSKTLHVKRTISVMTKTFHTVHIHMCITHLKQQKCKKAFKTQCCLLSVPFHVNFYFLFASNYILVFLLDFVNYLI